MANQYHLKELPANVKPLAYPVDKEVFDAAWADAQAGRYILWCGHATVPTIGERVTVRINGFGPGEVIGYFVQSNTLGVYVRPDVRPEWHQKQNPDRDYCMVFGAEIKL